MKAVTEVQNTKVQALEELSHKRNNVMNLQQGLNNQNRVNLALPQNITTTPSAITEQALSRVPFPTPSTTSQTTKSGIIFDAPKLNRNHSMLRTFVAKLRLKILGNGDRFSSVAHQLMYATERLEYTALKQIIPYITSTGVNFGHLKFFITILESGFGNSYRVATAERVLEYH